MNVQSGRKIKIDGPTYKQKLSLGWVPDFESGEIRPTKGITEAL
jgi:hypothetical protein